MNKYDPKTQDEIMRIESSKSVLRKKDVLGVFVVTAAILSVPLVAMQVSSEWNWGVFDFVVMGALLLVAGLFLMVSIRNIKTVRNRVLVAAGIVVTLLLIWAELAVGVFGGPFAGS